MSDLYSEIIGFLVVTAVVLMLAFYTQKMENKYKKENEEDNTKD